MLIDRRARKEAARTLLETAQVSPRAMTALFLGLDLMLSLVSYAGNGAGLVSTFLNVLTTVLSVVLSAGFVLYCMAIRRGERAEYLTIFDGFSLAGKIILLYLVRLAFIALWSMLFVIPGVVAYYRYRFALYNLLENPEMGVMEAMALSKRQTCGYKFQLFSLDLSYAGWVLLGSLPSMVHDGAVNYQLYSLLPSYFSNPGDILNLPPVENVLGIPNLVWQLLIPLWSLAVALFYYAQYHCVALSYFETARGTVGRAESVW